uniref:Peptidase M16 middle/third domain-containing protein n=1 Tax=Glossina brevipalpis TaxID=37001 RepID=A0A1A9W0E9_9MUSC
MVCDEPIIKCLRIPDKLENDKKVYKNFMLNNGLRVLLISDPSPLSRDDLSSSSYDSTASSEESSSDDEIGEIDCSSSDSFDSDLDDSDDEKCAAVALLLEVDSFSEYSKYKGLVHFLESRIFMGANKYPIHSETTACEETLYCFEIAEKHLDARLENFAALLKNPLLLREALVRELNALEMKFQKARHKDDCRRYQLLAGLTNQNFPHNVFSLGNLRSLKEELTEDELYKMLYEFRENHYSAHRMYFCLQSGLSIDEMESLIIKHFSDLPSNNFPGKDFRVYNYRDAMHFNNEAFFMKSIKKGVKLELTWVLPFLPKLYKCKPAQFLGYLLSHEGEGSLCSCLRRNLWATGVKIASHVYTTHSLFVLSIYLTNTGLCHLEDVLSCIFAFIKLLAQCGSLKEAYEDLQNIKARSLRFTAEKPAIDNVKNLVFCSKYYPSKDILLAKEFYFEYNEDQTRSIISLLNEFSFNIMITSKQPYNGITYDKKDSCYGTRFTSFKVPEKWRKLWMCSQPTSELFLPKRNRFITNDFHIFSHDDDSVIIRLEPKKIMQTDICELWFRQDDTFDLPCAYMYFYFISPLIRESAKMYAIRMLYTFLIKFRLKEDLYPATIAGLSYKVDYDERGIIFLINGFNEKLHLLVDTMTKNIVSMGEYINEELLEFIKTMAKDFTFNAIIQSKTLNEDLFFSVVDYLRFPLIDKYKCIDDVTLTDLLQYSKKYTKELYIKALVQGNLIEESAHNVMNSILTTLNCGNIKESKYLGMRTMQLPRGEHYIRCNAINSKDMSTVVTNFYQIGLCSVRTKSLLELIIMFIEEPLFDNLRNNNRFSHVASSAWINNGIACYWISVESEEIKLSAMYVNERIEAIRAKLFHILSEIDQEEFEEVLQSLIKMKLEPDKSLKEEVERNWDEIINEYYCFDRRHKEIDALRTITLQDVIDFWLINERNNLRKLSVQILGSSGHKKCNSATEYRTQTDKLADNVELKFVPIEDDPRVIMDINDFKQNLTTYPIANPNLDMLIIEPNEPINSNITFLIGD